MKRTIIALALFMAVAASAGLALASSITAPWYNETSGWSTFIIVTGDKTGGSTQSFTVTFYSSTGAALASTSNSVGATSAPWVHAASEFITQNTSSSFGSIEITEGTAGSGFDDINVLISVEKDSTGAGFILPLYPNTPNETAATTDKYGSE